MRTRVLTRQYYAEDRALVALRFQFHRSIQQFTEALHDSQTDALAWLMVLGSLGQLWPPAVTGQAAPASTHQAAASAYPRLNRAELTPTPFYPEIG